MWPGLYTPLPGDSSRESALTIDPTQAAGGAYAPSYRGQWSVDTETHSRRIDVIPSFLGYV